MHTTPEKNQVVSSNNENVDMETLTSPICAKAITNSTQKTLVTPEDRSNTISLSADDRHVAKTRKMTLKRNSSLIPDNLSERKKPSIEAQDSRLLNKYSLESKPPFVVNIERLSPLLSPQDTPENTKVQDSEATSASNHKEIKHFRQSESKQYGIIALGKRIAKHIDIFKHAFDLKSSGRNKFTVSFCEGSTANKFVDHFNKNKNTIFQGESWLAYVPNYKVIKQYIIRGVDDNDSAEELLTHIRPPPDWGILWTRICRF